MSPKAQRLIPPLLVLAAGTYLGWPPSAPLVNEDTAVRAKSVRWRPDDLAAPHVVAITKNPFHPVLVAADNLAVEEETGKLVPSTKPAGPPANDLQSGIKVSGIIATSGIRWAVLNDQPLTVGDQIETDDNHHHLCNIVHVGADHVVVQCYETRAVLSVNASAPLSSAAANPIDIGTRQPLPPQHANPPTSSPGQSANAPPTSGDDPPLSAQQLQTLLKLMSQG